MVPSGRQATFEYSFIPAEPMGGRPFGLVINLNYKDSNVSRLESSEKKLHLYLNLKTNILRQNAVFLKPSENIFPQEVMKVSG